MVNVMRRGMDRAVMITHQCFEDILDLVKNNYGKSSKRD